MKKLLYILFTLTLFTACSSDDDEDNNPYCWELIQHIPEKDDSRVTDTICDKTEKEMKEYVQYWNDILKKNYDEGKIDYFRWLSYQKK